MSNSVFTRWTLLSFWFLFLPFHQSNADAAEKANATMLQGKRGGGDLSAVNVGEPSLMVLNWAEVSRSGEEPRTRPLFNLRGLLALAQPSSAEAQLSGVNIGDYLYNPDSYVSVEPRLSRLLNRSGLVLLPEKNLRAYFGLLHSHTFSSDGIGDARDAFRIARDVAGLDFFAVTDHAEYWWKKASRDWSRLLELEKSESRPGFVALAGFEYSHPVQGHVVVLNSSHWTSFLQTPTLAKFYDWLASDNQAGSISIFAHPGFHKYRNFFDLGHFKFDSRLKSRFVGVETTHKNVWSRSLKGYSGRKSHLDEASELGWWLAPMASQDNHTPFWGVSDQSRIAVLMEEELSRDALMRALARRHVYSTQSPQLQLVLALYNKSELVAVMGDIRSRASVSDEGNFLRLRMIEPNPMLKPQKIEFLIDGRVVRSLTFLDKPSSQAVMYEDSEGERTPWWERLLNNGLVTEKPYDWLLEPFAQLEPEIFEVNVPLSFPPCPVKSKSGKSKAWTFGLRFYQGHNLDYLTTTAPIVVKCD
ncbi:MAG: CehA/McbA family metallohydrolase [Silvanigrellaceae bacterium]